MILTLTPNAALDRVLFIDEVHLGTTMSPHKMVDAVGGKGLDTSVALAILGVDTLALSFVGGEIGRQLVALLDEYGVAHDMIWLAGETRLSHVIAETRTQRHTHLIAGSLPISAEAGHELLQRYRQHAQRAAWIVAGGSLPPGLPHTYYQTIIEIAHELGVPILLDSRGPTVLQALAAPPTILKMNWAEFVETFAVTASTLAQLQSQAQAVFVQKNLAALVLTCGEQGILACTPTGAYMAVAPRQKAINAAGAGDTASATIAWRQGLGDSWPETLRWAAAVSAAAVLTERTAEFLLEDVERLLPQVTIDVL